MNTRKDTLHTTIPNELYWALLSVLSTVKPILKDWTNSTGFGEVYRRDKAALDMVEAVIRMHDQWVLERSHEI